VSCGLHAGFGRADITPPPGLDLTGFIARENPGREILHPLHARAAVLELPGTLPSRLLIVSLECLALGEELAHTLRTRLTRTIGMPPHGITLWCTHTHSGPATIPLHGCGQQDHTYLNGTFIEGVVNAARQAMANLAPVSLAWAAADAAAHHEYRRAGLRGTGRADCIDHAVRTLWCISPPGDVRGCLWSYAAHPTLLCEPAASGDYVGVTCRHIEAATGGTALFGQGCAGDVAPRAEGTPREAVQQLGAALARKVLQTRGAGKTVPVDCLGTCTASAVLPLSPAPPPAWYARCAGECEQDAAGLPPGTERRALLAMAAWARHWSKNRPPSGISIQLQVARIGPLRFVALPFEPFSAIGLQIRSRIGHEAVVIGYANACHGYLAPADEIERGGYEIEQAYRYYGLPSPPAPDADEHVVTTACQLCP
jgi:hypothetical protein